VLSVSDWLKLPDVAAPTVRDESETGTIVMVAKVGFLLAIGAECEKAAIRPEHGLNGKHVLPTAMIKDGDQHLCTGYQPTSRQGSRTPLRSGAHRREPVSPKVEFGRLNGLIYAQFELPNERLH
jgi:hypothetical protein